MGRRLAVSEIFESVQGEGINVGKPAVFLRLSYCNLACQWCIGYKPGRHKPKVWTLNGRKNIWDVQTGTRLLAVDERGNPVQTEVKRVLTRRVREYIQLEFQNRPSLFTTPEHPFLVEGKWTEARNLKIGDEVMFVSPNEYLSFRMRLKNPMSDKVISERHRAKLDYRSIAIKVSRTRKRLFREGKLKPPGLKEEACPLCGKSSFNIVARLRMAHGKNPMKDPEIVEVVRRKMRIRPPPGFKVMRQDPGFRASVVERMRSSNPMKRPDVAMKNWISHQSRPSSIENLVVEICQMTQLPLDYVGNGRVWVGSTSDRLLNPDFLVRGHRKVVEVYDSSYKVRDYVKWKKARQSHYSRHDYKCLFLDVNKRPPEDIENQLINFVRNGIKVRATKHFDNRIRYVYDSKGSGAKKISDEMVVYNFRCEPYNSFVVDGLIVHNCDTKYTWDWSSYRPSEEIRFLEIGEVEGRVRGYRPKLLVVTGGEPLLQKYALADLLGNLKPDYFVEVETDGTIAPTIRLLSLVDRWNVSPKLENSGNPLEKRDIPAVMKTFAALPNAFFKFVVESGRDIPEVEGLIEKYGLPRERILLMPEGTEAETVARRSWELIGQARKLRVGFTTRLHIIKWGNQRGK